MEQVLSINHSNSIIGLDRPWGFQEVETPRFQDNRHMKAAFKPKEIFLVIISIRDWDNPKAGRVMSRKNYNDTIGKRTRDLRVCSVVLQPTASPRAPGVNNNNNNNKNHNNRVIPVIIGATGTISKSFRQYVSTIRGNHDVRELQKTAILGTAHILRKVLM
jgi:hypothetical protein